MFRFSILVKEDDNTAVVSHFFGGDVLLSEVNKDSGYVLCSYLSLVENYQKYVDLLKNYYGDNFLAYIPGASLSDIKNSVLFFIGVLFANYLLENESTKLSVVELFGSFLKSNLNNVLTFIANDLGLDKEFVIPILAICRNSIDNETDLNILNKILEHLQKEK